MFNDHCTCSSLELSQNGPTVDPVEKLELSTLNVDVASVSFNVPSFPRSHECLPVDGTSVAVGSDVFSLSQGLEGPSTVDLLFCSEKLSVGRRSGNVPLKIAGVGGQVTVSHSEGEVIELFAPVADVSEIPLGVEKVGCQIVSVKLGFDLQVSRFGHFI